MSSKAPICTAKTFNGPSFSLEGSLTFVPLADGRLPRATVVMLHGILSHRDHNFAPQLADRLAKDLPVTVVRFDFRFDPATYRFSAFDEDLVDLQLVMQQLEKDGFTPFCILGHSRGANDTLLYASGRKSDGSPLASAPAEGIRCAVSLAARHFMPRMFTTLFNAETVAEVDSKGQAVWKSKKGDLTVTKDDAEIVRSKMDMAATVAAIRVPVLFVHGTEDEIIPVEDAVALFQGHGLVSTALALTAEHGGHALKEVEKEEKGSTEGSAVAAAAAAALSPSSSSPTSAAASAAASASLAGCQLKIIQGARHGLLGKAVIRELLETVSRFIALHVPAGAGSVAAPSSDAAAQAPGAVAGTSGGAGSIGIEAVSTAAAPG